MKSIKGAQTWRSILGTQTVFWPLTPPPPILYQPIDQPLSKALCGVPNHPPYGFERACVMLHAMFGTCTRTIPPN